MVTAVLDKKKVCTYSDYAKLPEGAPYQLIGGRLIKESAPVPYHQMISKNLGFALYEFVEKENDLGKIFFSPIDVYFEEKEVYQPDIIFISRKRLNLIGEKKIDGAPDLIIEILSPSKAYYDLSHKEMIYAKHGVKEYWVVGQHENSIEIFTNKQQEFVSYSKVISEGTVKSKILKGFEVNMEDIF